MPTIYGDETGIFAVWASNTDNDIFGQNTNNQIMKNSFNGINWEYASVVSSGLSIIDIVTGGKAEDNNIIAWAVDTDSDAETMTDKEIFINNNGVTARLTNNETIDSKPFFANDNRLYWYNNGQINYISDFETNTINKFLSEGIIIPNDRFIVMSNTNA